MVHRDERSLHFILSSGSERNMTDWFVRPVLHVTHVDASIRFYMDRRGFSNPWHFEEGGKTFVAQVERQGCALILSSHWPEKVGKGLMFISLNVEPETHEAAVAALDALRAELEATGAPVRMAGGATGSWVEDPDGNRSSTARRASPGPSPPSPNACRPSTSRSSTSSFRRR